jgi:uncharacterized repeat protein (TIGR03833 family)
MENQYLNNIKKGLKVEILSSNNKLFKGVVEDIASRKEFSSEGIMVRLKSGEIGRIQKIIKNKSNSEIDIENWIKGGENFNLEFKSSALWSQFFNEEQIKQSKSYDLHLFKQKASRFIIAKSIAAFLNSEGGNLLIGIKEKKGEKGEFDVIGIEEDLKKLKDQTKDGYKRMIFDDILRSYFSSKIFNHLNNYVIIGFIDLNGKTICNIKMNRSDVRVFLKINDREFFMIRVDSENRSLDGEKLVDYCIKHFKN